MEFIDYIRLTWLGILIIIFMHYGYRESSLKDLFNHPVLVIAGMVIILIITVLVWSIKL